MKTLAEELLLYTIRQLWLKSRRKSSTLINKDCSNVRLSKSDSSIDLVTQNELKLYAIKITNNLIFCYKTFYLISLASLQNKNKCINVVGY